MIIGSNTPFENRAKKNLQVGVKYFNAQIRKNTITKGEFSIKFAN